MDFKGVFLTKAFNYIFPQTFWRTLVQAKQNILPGKLECEMSEVKLNIKGEDRE